MDYSEKVAYIKGLAEDIGLKAENPLDKLTLGIIDALSDMAEIVKDLENATDSLEVDVEDISEHLNALSGFADDDDDYEAKCPSCGNIISIDPESIEEGFFVCPECGEHLEFDLSSGHGCDCGGCCGEISHIHGGPTEEEE